MKKTLRTTHTRTQLCPKCNAVLDAATSMEGDFTPQEGGLSICAECGLLLQYGDGLILSELSDEEFKTLPEETQTTLLKAKYWIEQKFRPAEAR